MAAFSAIEGFYDSRVAIFALVRRDVGGGSLLQVAPMFWADVTSSGLGRSNLRLAGSAVTGGRRGAASNRRVASARVSLSRSRASASSDRLPATADAVAHERSDNCLPISSTPRGMSIAGEPVLDSTSP